MKIVVPTSLPPEIIYSSIKQEAMKRLTALIVVLTACANYSIAQCNGGFVFATVNAPTNTTTTTIETCNWAGDYNVIDNVVAGSTYTLTATGSQCITMHSGSPSGTIVGYGTGSVTFTAPTSGTYYMTLTTNCSGCGSGSTCIVTEITCNSCGTGPCASITNIPGCGQAFVQTTSGSSSFVSSLCATSTPGLEFIYSYTATSTGNYSFNISSISGGGVAIGYQASSGGCSASGWNCAATATTPGSYGSIALVAGTTYYFLFDATSTASTSVTFSLTCPAGGPTTAGDCGIAANVCSDASFAVDPNGYGAIDEICTYCTSNPDVNPASSNTGCLISGELNSTWMIVNVLTGGTLEFQIGTPNSGTWNCLDWSMWTYSPTTCAAIQAGTQAPVRCNYNGDCEEFTGIAATLPSGATSMTNWEPPLTVGSATQYIICLSNYSSATTTVPLSFGGTAVVSCSPLGTEAISLAGTGETGYNQLNWTSSAEFNASEYRIERSKVGINFEIIGTVEANGLSMEAQHYDFADLTPHFGKNYYRVTMIHQNNTTITSEMIVVEQSAASTLVRCFPNPAKSQLHIILASQTNTSYELILTELNGKEIIRQNESMSDGLQQVVLDLSLIHSGMYLLDIRQNGKTIATQKIIRE